MSLPVPRPEHLTDAELLLVIHSAQETPQIQAMQLHLEACDSCLLQLADLCHKLAVETDRSMSLRAVNAAGAKWKMSANTSAAVTPPETTPDWKEAALLGKHAYESPEPEAPLLTLLLGRRKAKAAV